MPEADGSPTLAEYLADNDPNAFWRLSCGDHENLLDEAIDALRKINAEALKAERDALRRRLDKANAVCVAVDRYWMGKPMPYQISAALTEWATSEAVWQR